MTGPRLPYQPPVQDHATLKLPPAVHDLAHDVAVAIIPIILAWLARLLMPKAP